MKKVDSTGMFSGADPSFNDDVLREHETRGAKDHPTKAQLRQLANYRTEATTVAVFAFGMAVAGIDGCFELTEAPIDASNRSVYSEEANEGLVASDGLAWYERVIEPRDLVPVSEWPKPSRRAFAAVAAEDLSRLKQWMLSGALDEVHLSFAAEALGEHGDGDGVETLLSLLASESPIVREGAVLGLSHHVDEREEVANRLRAVAENDESKGVRSAAHDVMVFAS